MDYDNNVPSPLTMEDRIKTFRAMKVGDSFMVDEGIIKWRLAMSRAHSNGSCYFISRTVDGGVRFWRKG